MRYSLTMLVTVEQDQSRGEYSDLALRSFLQHAIMQAVPVANIAMPVGLRVVQDGLSVIAVIRVIPVTP